MTWQRFVGILLVLGFIAFFWKSPVGAANLVTGFFQTVGVAFDKIVAFFVAL